MRPLRRPPERAREMLLIAISGYHRLPASGTVAATGWPTASRRPVPCRGRGVLFPEKGSGKGEINADRTSKGLLPVSAKFARPRLAGAAPARGAFNRQRFSG